MEQIQAKETSFTLENDNSWKAKLPEFRNIIEKILSESNTLTLARVAHKGLFSEYLAALPATLSQQYNCRCCEEFFDDYSGVVVLNNDGGVTSPFFTPELAPEGMEEAYEYIAKKVSKATVVDFFRVNERRKPTKGNPKWTHWGIDFKTLTTEAAKVGNGRNLLEEMMIISEGHKGEIALMCARAVRVLTPFADQSSTVRGHLAMVASYSQAYKYATLPESETGAVNRRNAFAACVINDHLLYHFPQTTIGKLVFGMKDCEVDSAEEKRLVANYMSQTDNTVYKRATEQANQVEVAKAEKFLVENGYADSIKLRQATASDFTSLPLLWAEKGTVEAPAEKEQETSLFGILKETKGNAEKKAIDDLPKMERNLGEVTLTRFFKDILPNALKIQVFIASLSDSVLCSALVQSNAESKPLYRHDAESRANGQKHIPLPFSIRLDRGPMEACSFWGIRKPTLIDVKEMYAVPSDSRVNVWEAPALRMFCTTEDMDAGVLDNIGSATIFPASLVSELQPYRAVMENFIGKTGYGKTDNPVGGVMLGESSPTHLLVETATEKLVIRLGKEY